MSGEMDAGLKAKWIAALRSGKYEQVRMALRRTGYNAADTYCCLGVLCVVAGIDPGVGLGRDDAYLALDKLISHPFRIRCEVKNDNEGQSFAQIAEWLESQP